MPVNLSEMERGTSILCVSVCGRWHLTQGMAKFPGFWKCDRGNTCAHSRQAQRHTKAPSAPGLPPAPTNTTTTTNHTPANKLQLESLLPGERRKTQRGLLQRSELHTKAMEAGSNTTSLTPTKPRDG